jgi:hypothetical protein
VKEPNAHLREMPPAALTIGKQIVSIDDETGEVHLTYIARPEIRGVGRVVAHDDRTAESEAELSMPDGTVVARATATFRIIRRRDAVPEERP